MTYMTFFPLWFAIHATDTSAAVFGYTSLMPWTYICWQYAREWSVTPNFVGRSCDVIDSSTVQLSITLHVI